MPPKMLIHEIFVIQALLRCLPNQMENYNVGSEFMVEEILDRIVRADVMSDLKKRIRKFIATLKN